MKIYKSLVIGGSGFLGSHLADYLLKKKHRVTVLDIKKSKWLQKHLNEIYYLSQ